MAGSAATAIFSAVASTVVAKATAPDPPKVSLPPPPEIDDIEMDLESEPVEQEAPEEAAQLTQTEAQRRRAAQSTIKTSPQGVLEPPTTTSTLLGG